MPSLEYLRHRLNLHQQMIQKHNKLASQYAYENRTGLYRQTIDRIQQHNDHIRKIKKLLPSTELASFRNPLKALFELLAIPVQIVNPVRDTGDRTINDANHEWLRDDNIGAIHSEPNEDLQCQAINVKHYHTNIQSPVSPYGTQSYTLSNLVRANLKYLKK